jgi:hypothetical protein
MTTCDEDLQAFVDGEQLPPERRRTVMAYLAAHPEEEARIGDYRRLNESLHLLYDDVLYEPLSARLRVERRRGSWGRLAPLAAGVAILLLVGAGNWMLRHHSIEPEAKRPPLDSEEYSEPESLLFRLSELQGQVVKRFTCRTCSIPALHCAVDVFCLLLRQHACVEGAPGSPLPC